MTLAAAPHSPVDYPALFRTYVQRTVAHVLTWLQHESPPPTEVERRQALHALSYALKLPDAWPTARELLLELAPRMEQAGHQKDWASFLRRGIEQSQHFGDRKAEAELCFHLGVIHQRQAEFAAACDELAASATLFEQMGDPLRQARALNRLAFVARLEGQLEEAMQLVGEAHSLAKGDTGEEAYNHLVLGAIALDQLDGQKAKTHFEQSLSLWEETGNMRMIAWSQNNIGIALWQLEQYKEAAKAYESALRLFERIEDPLHSAAARANLGNAYLMLGEAENALACYFLADPVFRRTYGQFHLAVIETNKGKAYRQLQRWDKAIEAYQEGIERWRGLNNSLWLVNAMDGLGLCFLGQAQYGEAIAIFKEAMSKLGDATPENDPVRTELVEHLAEAREGLSQQEKKDAPSGK